jgi:hypothetical protein
MNLCPYREDSGLIAGPTLIFHSAARRPPLLSLMRRSARRAWFGAQAQSTRAGKGNRAPAGKIGQRNALMSLLLRG